jgi:hypothetical protein
VALAAAAFAVGATLVIFVEYTIDLLILILLYFFHPLIAVSRASSAASRTSTEMMPVSLLMSIFLKPSTTGAPPLKYSTQLGCGVTNLGKSCISTTVANCSVRPLADC